MIRARSAALALALVALLCACGGNSDSNAGRTFTITAPSMEPTFKKGDKVTIADPPAKLKVGMIVVFTQPSGWVSEGKKPLTMVKRVLGVGGDRVSCCDAAGLISINGTAMNESSYLAKGSHPSDQTFDVTVPTGQLWLMGDNRGNSYDSRFHTEDPGDGFVPAKNVIGIVVKKSEPAHGPGY